MNLLLIFTASISSILMQFSLLLLSASGPGGGADAAGTWQTIRNHQQSRPNISEQLKPTHEHYGRSEVDYGPNHPFDRHLQQQQQQKYTETLDYGADDGSSTPDYDILRMRFLTEPLNSLRGQRSASTDAQIDSILNEVLPTVMRTWMTHLSVIPVQGAIPIQRNDCFGIYDGLIPNDVLVNGVEDADLVIFVSGKNVMTTSDGQRVGVCGPGTLAAATSCVLDQFDRPIVGFINFCLDEVTRRLEEAEETTLTNNDKIFLPKVNLVDHVTVESTQDSKILLEDAIVTDRKLVATHEVGHVLGMDSELFLFFRDAETGEPLTPRPFKEELVVCVDLSEQLRVFPSEATLQSAISSQGRLYYDLVTPRTQTVVRNHFNCQSLAGARLENQPTGDSCSGAHFDERLFYSELMGPIFSGTTDVLSPLTLALLEDSGWYKVFYEGSEVSPYGHAAGCPFVNDDCIINNKVPDYAAGAFCTRATKVNLSSGQIEVGSNDVLCDPTHRSMGICDLFDRITSGFEFDPMGARYFSDLTLQALTSQNDWCPVPSIPTGIDCTDKNGPQLVATYTGEEYGPTSRCVNFEKGIFARSVAGCFNVQCDAENRRVIVNGQTCNFDGEVIEFRRTDGFFKGNMICPSLAVICPQLYCQAGCSARGLCNYDTNQCECFDADDTTPICSGSDVRAPFTLSPTPAPAPFSSASTNFCSSLATIITLLGLFLCSAL